MGGQRTAKQEHWEKLLPKPRNYLGGISSRPILLATVVTPQITRVYDVRPRSDKRGVDLISKTLQFAGKFKEW